MKKIFAVIALTLTLTTYSSAYSADSDNTAKANAESSISYANNSITGQIVDSDSFSPLNCAVITIDGLSNQSKGRITSNENGIFELKGIPAGQYQMTVTFPGCDTIKMFINVDGTVTDMGVIEIK